MKPKELIKTLESQGWYIDRVQGAHYIMKHPVRSGRPVIPYHNRDLKPGTLNGILKEAGLK